MDYQLLCRQLQVCVLDVDELVELTQQDDDDYFREHVGRTLGHLWSLLDLASRQVVPNPKIFAGHCDAPPPPIGNITGSSWHDLARSLAWKVFFGSLRAADPSRHWEIEIIKYHDLPDQDIFEGKEGEIRGFLKTLPTFDAGSICSWIEYESARVQRSMGGTLTMGSVPEKQGKAKKRASKAETEIKVIAAKTYKVENPGASTVEVADEVGLSRSTLQCRRDWGKWCLEVEQAEKAGRMDAMKTKLDNLTGSVVSKLD